MPKDKSFAKSPEKSETSSTLVIVACLLIAVTMPFVRALARGDNEVTAAASYAAVTRTHAHSTTLAGHDSADELSMMAAGAFLLGLGVVLRRLA